MRKVLSILLLLLFCLSAKAYDFVVGKIAYSVVSMNDSICEVAQYGEPNKYFGIINIPESVTYQGRTFKVIAIGESAFYTSKISSVVIPNSVTELKKRAFSCCGLLNSVTIPSSVIKIGDYCFSSCNRMLTFKLPDSIEFIGEGAFCNCQSLTSITIPQKITELKYDTFSDCKRLRNVTFHDTFLRLGQSVFSGCDALTTIALPNSLQYIGPSCFYKCKLLRNIEIPNSVTVIENYCFSECPSLTNVKLSENITSIPGGCFSENNSLRVITIPDSVKVISASAFDHCASLTTIKGGNNIDEIDNQAFDECISLRDFTLPQSLLRIGTCAFRSCKKFKDFRIPGNLQVLGQAAFIHVNPSKVVLPPTLRFMGCEPFSFADTVVIEYNDKPFKWENDFEIATHNLWIDRDITYKCAGRSFIRMDNVTIGPHEIAAKYAYYANRDETKTLTALFPTPPNVQELSNHAYINVILFVPQESLDSYKAHPIWGKFWNIQPIISSH